MNKEKNRSFFKEWKEKPESVKAATYFSTVAFQTLICALFFILAFAFFFDTDCGYFRTGSLIPSVAWASLFVFVLWAASSVFFMKNEKLPDTVPADGRISFFAAEYLGFICGFDGLYRIKQIISESSEYLTFFDKTYFGSDYAGYRLYRVSFIVDIATAVFCFGTAAYFFCMSGKVKRSEAKALLGLFPVLRALSGITQVYFEPKIPMNTPMKMLCEAAMMASVLFFLAEIRFLLDERYARPGWYFTAGLVGCIANFTSGAALLVFYFAKSEAYSGQVGISGNAVSEFVSGCGEICLEAFFCINIFLYIIVRLLCFVRRLVKGDLAEQTDASDGSECEQNPENACAAEGAEVSDVSENCNPSSADDAPAEGTESCLQSQGEPDAEKTEQSGTGGENES